MAQLEGFSIIKRGREEFLDSCLTGPYTAVGGSQLNGVVPQVQKLDEEG